MTRRVQEVHRFIAASVKAARSSFEADWQPSPARSLVPDPAYSVNTCIADDERIIGAELAKGQPMLRHRQYFCREWKTGASPSRRLNP